MKLESMSTASRQPSGVPGSILDSPSGGGSGQDKPKTLHKNSPCPSKPVNVNDVVIADLMTRVSQLDVTNGNAPLPSHGTQPTNPKPLPENDTNPTGRAEMENIQEKLATLTLKTEDTPVEEEQVGVGKGFEAEQTEGNDLCEKIQGIDIAKREETEGEDRVSCLQYKVDDAKDTVDVSRVKVEDGEKFETLDKADGAKVSVKEVKFTVDLKGIKEEELKDKDKVVPSSGGNLCPRSPVRPEFSQSRIDPYHTSRSLHHGGGGTVRVAQPVGDARASIGFHQNSWLNNVNVLPLNIPLDVCSYQETTAFVSSADSPQECDVDEGIYEDVAQDLATNPEYWSTVFESVMTRTVAAEPAPDIPESVSAFETDQPNLVDTKWRTESIPSVSSGYNSSSSPRSTSTPSPSSSPEASQERFAETFYGAADARQEYSWHGTTSEVYHEPDVVFDSDLLEQLVLDTTDLAPSLSQEICRPLSYCEAFVETNAVLTTLTPLPTTLTPLSSDLTLLGSDLGLVQPHVGRSGASVLARIQPKPSAVAMSAKTRLLGKLDKDLKRKIWATVSAIKDEEVTCGDEDGDTQLMILLLKESPCCKLEYVYALVERLKGIPGALSAINNQRQSALYLSALHCPHSDSALISRYIAESMVDTQAGVNMVYENGDTVLHRLCRGGSRHYETLRELLSVKDVSGRLCFDVDTYNNKGMTPLLEAVTSHGHVDSVKTVRLLITSGADTALPSKTDCGMTALRLAVTSTCDPRLVDALLSDARLAARCGEAAAYGADSVLHDAARQNGVAADRQLLVCRALLERGARRDARDGEGRLPVELIGPDRREAFKLIGQKR